MTPETQEAVQVTLNVLKAGDGTRRHGELLERVIRDLTAERDRAKGIAKGLHKELRDAVAARGQAERERDEARAELERVRELAARWAECAPPDEWPDSGNLADSIQSDYGRAVLAALDGEGT